MKNYHFRQERPITLPSVPGKVFAHILVARLDPLLKEHRRGDDPISQVPRSAAPHWMQFSHYGCRQNYRVRSRACQQHRHRQTATIRSYDSNLFWHMAPYKCWLLTYCFYSKSTTDSPGLASSVACASVASPWSCAVASRTAVVGRLFSLVIVAVKFAVLWRRLCRTSADASDSCIVKCCRAPCQNGWTTNSLQRIRRDASLVSRPSSRLWNSTEGFDDTPDPTHSRLMH